MTPEEHTQQTVVFDLQLAPGGDAVLRAFADACTDAVRSNDFVGRYGGEEFVLFLPGASGGAAEAVTKDISRRLAAAAQARPCQPPATASRPTTGKQATLMISSAQPMRRSTAPRHRAETAPKAPPLPDRSDNILPGHAAHGGAGCDVGGTRVPSTP